jgi:hypothetical protein
LVIQCSLFLYVFSLFPGPSSATIEKLFHRRRYSSDLLWKSHYCTRILVY